jgi:hypothetical protein
MVTQQFRQVEEPKPGPIAKYQRGGKTWAERKAAKSQALRVARLRKLGRVGVRAGLGLGAAGLVGSVALGEYRKKLQQQAILDLLGGEDRLRQQALMKQAQAASYEDAIQRNLQRLSQAAPDLYASVAAGRKLPQGGVVIGGAPRQDLLNELGRAMADGRFSR